MLSNGFDRACNRGGLLPDRDVDADYIRRPLIDDGIDSDGGFAGGSITNNELTLSPSDREQCVDAENARLHRFRDQAPLHNGRSRAFDSLVSGSIHSASIIQGAAHGIHDAAQQSWSDWNPNDVPRPSVLGRLL